METPYYQEHSEQAKRLLARMKIDLEQYAAKPDANERFVAKQQEIIDRWCAFVDAADGYNAVLMDMIEETSATRYQQGYNNGYQAAESIYTLEHHRHNRELYRTHSIERARKQWPELMER